MVNGVNFPDLPPVPQWLKDILGDTSESGKRGLWAGSHMMADSKLAQPEGGQT